MANTARLETLELMASIVSAHIEQRVTLSTKQAFELGQLLGSLIVEERERLRKLDAPVSDS
jgi:hypothetical protein